MFRSVPFAMGVARSLIDCVAIVIIWCIVLFAGCSSIGQSGSGWWFASREPEGPQTVGEFMSQPRVGSNMKIVD